MYNNITPYVKHQFSYTSSKGKPDTNKTYTPQPSTPIKHAGSNLNAQPDTSTMNTKQKPESRTPTQPE